MLVVAGCGLAIVVAVVAIPNIYVLATTAGDSTANANELTHAQTALILGAFVQPDGHLSSMLSDRVKRGAELWMAHKVDSILVSGDHAQWSYDEPDAMRKALQAQGVPDRAIFTDHAGFNTWASVVRARKVFGVKKVIVVTQGFHMPRALFLADAAGLEAQGLTSDLQPYGKYQMRSQIREFPARVKAVGAATFNRSVLLGPSIPISGDGRQSWGPQPAALSQ